MKPAFNTRFATCKYIRTYVYIYIYTSPKHLYMILLIRWYVYTTSSSRLGPSTSPEVSCLCTFRRSKKESSVSCICMSCFFFHISLGTAAMSPRVHVFCAYLLVDGRDKAEPCSSNDMAKRYGNGYKTHTHTRRNMRMRVHTTDIHTPRNGAKCTCQHFPLPVFLGIHSYQPA